MPSDRCPPKEQLQAFQLGNLAEPSLTEIADHLECCPRCEARAQQLDSELDAMMAALRRPSAECRSFRKPDRTFGVRTAVALLALAVFAGFALRSYWGNLRTPAPNPVAENISAPRPDAANRDAAVRPPVYPPVAGAVYLSELPVLNAVAWPFRGRLPVHPGHDEPADWPAPCGGHRVRVAGRASLHGIWMHLPHGGGPTSISYRLDRRFARFTAEVTLNDGPPECTPLTFAVYGDGRPLWQSKPVSTQSDLHACAVSVAGIAVLTLEVSGTGDERGTHAAWVEPYVAR